MQLRKGTQLVWRGLPELRSTGCLNPSFCDHHTHLSHEETPGSGFMIELHKPQRTDQNWLENLKLDLYGKIWVTC